MSFSQSPTTNIDELLPRAVAVIDRGIAAGLHIGAQAFVAIDNRTIADFGRGQSRPGVLMTADTVMLWLSSTKPIGAAAVLQLVERGKLALDEPVAAYIGEFAARGKQAITTRHILTHTGGFRWADIAGRESSWDDVIAHVCEARLERNWIVGETAGYHPATSWYILGELVRRIDGRAFSQYVRDEIFLPLGMADSWIGMPAAQFEAYGERLGVMMHTEKTPHDPNAYSTLAGATACVPGGNGHGPMHDLGRFYEMLLGDGQLRGARVLSPQSVRLMTTPQRIGKFDETFKHVMDWGLGMIIDSNRYGADSVPYGYGKYSSPATFGHGGRESSVAFADSQRRLVVAVVFNGMPGEAKHNQRMRNFLAALYEDLGLV